MQGFLSSVWRGTSGTALCSWLKDLLLLCLGSCRAPAPGLRFCLLPRQNNKMLQSLNTISSTLLSFPKAIQEGRKYHFYLCATLIFVQLAYSSILFRWDRLLTHFLSWDRLYSLSASKSGFMMKFSLWEQHKDH